MPHAIKPMLNEGVRAFRVREDLGKGELNGVCLSQDASHPFSVGPVSSRWLATIFKWARPLI